MTENPRNLLTDYVRAFETLSPDAVTPFIHLPCMFIGPQGAVAVSDVQAASAVVTHLMNQAKSQGYHRSEILDVTSKRLADDLAWLTGVYVRLNKAAEEIARFGFSYVLRRHQGTWKIAVAMAHDVSPADFSIQAPAGS